MLKNELEKITLDYEQMQLKKNNVIENLTLELNQLKLDNQSILDEKKKSIESYNYQLQKLTNDFELQNKSLVQSEAVKTD